MRWGTMESDWIRSHTGTGEEVNWVYNIDPSVCMFGELRGLISRESCPEGTIG